MLYKHSNKNIDKIQKSTQKKKPNYTVTLVLQSRHELFLPPPTVSCVIHGDQHHFS